MNAETIQPFKTTLLQLEQLIRQLEINVGVEHRPSPFQTFIQVPQPVVEQKLPQQQQQPQQQEPQQQEPQQQQPQQQEKQEKKQKKEPKQQQQQQQQQANNGNNVPEEWADLSSVDIRVGEIVQCWKHPESDKLYCEKIDIGGEVREIASGLQTFIPIEQMSGLVLVLTNLKGRKLAGFMSNGMVLCASNADHSQVEILRPQAGSKVGERVRVAGVEQYFKDELEPVLNPKKKQWENVQPLLKTTENKEASYKGQLLVTSVGPICSQSLVNASIS